jgi:hypothetical protein
MQLMTLARWLAQKAVKSEWKAEGRKVQYIPASEITAAAAIYLLRHRTKLMKEAWEHPVAVRRRQQERMTLARKAVIAEIRDKGRKVSSIAPAELQRLIEAYVEEHPELRECGCF